jgi:hypothetical protein
MATDSSVLVALISTIGSVIALYFKHHHATNRTLHRTVKKHALQIKELLEWKERCQSASHYY